MMKIGCVYHDQHTYYEIAICTKALDIHTNNIDNIIT